MSSYQDLNQESLSIALVQAADGKPERVAELLAAGADPNGLPLLMAIQSNEPQIVQMMIDAGADVNRPFARTTPLIRAIASGHPLIVRVLLAAGADVNQKDSSGFTPLSVALGKTRLNATEEERNTIIRMLQMNGAHE